MLAKSRRVRLEERLPKAGVTEGRQWDASHGSHQEGAEDLPGWRGALGLQAIGTSPRLLGPCCDWKN